MNDVVIRVENLSKKYEIGSAKYRSNSLRDQLSNSLRSLFQRNGRSPGKKETFWALKNISFVVNQGDIVGIIGRNGAGKTTLLKILSRITEPTAGFAEIRGRVGALLEVGTGFHAELSGRENIYLNGAILGMKKVEIDRKFDEIVAFAEVEKFIDTPVKYYSSGMYVRLAFSVAAHLEPEVLLVDEVLAVGDVAFQKKCLGKMENVAAEGRTVVFVSHNLAVIEHLCHKGIVIQNGDLVFHGPAKQSIEYYLSGLSTGPHASTAHVFDLANSPGRPSKHRPILKSLELFTDGDKPLKSGLVVGSSLKAYVRLSLDQPTSHLDACLGFDTLLGQRIFTAHTAFQPGRAIKECAGEQTFVCEIPRLTLVPGEYKILVALGIANITVDLVEDAARINVLESDFYGTGKVPWNGLIVLEHHWHIE